MSWSYTSIRKSAGDYQCMRIEFNSASPIYNKKLTEAGHDNRSVNLSYPLHSSSFRSSKTHNSWGHGVGAGRGVDDTFSFSD